MAVKWQSEAESGNERNRKHDRRSGERITYAARHAAVQHTYQGDARAR